MRHILLMALGALALTGCSASLSDVPSLAPRPAEHQAILPPDQAREAESAATPALVQKLNVLLAEARKGHARFAEESRAATAALGAARGTPEGSEAWIAGQAALSALDAAKSPVRDAATAVDTLRVDPANAGSGDRAAIEAAADEIATMADEEARIIDSLSR